MTEMDGDGQQNGSGFGFVRASLNFVVPGFVENWHVENDPQCDVDGGLQGDCFENIDDGNRFSRDLLFGRQREGS